MVGSKVKGLGCGVESGRYRVQGLIARDYLEGRVESREGSVLMF